MMRVCAFTLMTLTVVSRASADEYWITYEGDQLPEKVGWHRTWGNSKGQFRGDGAIRTIENGALVMDSRFDASVWDFNRLERPGRLDPGPGETFRADWRIFVFETQNWYDPEVTIVGDRGAFVSIGHFADRVRVSPGGIMIEVEPLAWHTFSISSSDMVRYEFLIDGEPAYSGEFLTRATPESTVAFGDSVQGASSLAAWDYVRFGVVPEPSSAFILLSLMLTAYSGQRRHENRI